MVIFLRHKWRSEALARVRAYLAVWMSTGRSPSADALDALDQPLVEGRGGGDRAPGVPFEPVGPGHPLSAQTPDPQTPRSHQETWADCLTRTFAPTWTRS